MWGSAAALHRELFDIDVNLRSIHLLKGLDRSMGMIPALLTKHINAAETARGALDERFHVCALRHIGGKSRWLCRRWPRSLDHCVDPVRTPRSQYNFAPLCCEKFRVLSPMPLLAPVILNLPVIFEFYLLLIKNLFSRRAELHWMMGPAISEIPHQ